MPKCLICGKACRVKYCTPPTGEIHSKCQIKAFNAQRKEKRRLESELAPCLICGKETKQKYCQGKNDELSECQKKAKRIRTQIATANGKHSKPLSRDIPSVPIKKKRVLPVYPDESKYVRPEEFTFTDNIHIRNQAARGMVWLTM